MTLFPVIGTLRPLFAKHPWLILGMVGLGWLATLMEGIGITLFIPLFYSLQDAPLHLEELAWIEHALHRAFAGVPPDDRVLIIALCIFGLVGLKGLFSFLNGLLFSWVDATLYHDTRQDLLARILEADLSFTDRYPAGVLLEIFEDGTWRLVETLASLVGLIITLLSIGVLVGLLLLISWPLTLLVGLGLLVTTLPVRLLKRRVEAEAYACLQIDETISQHTLEIFRSLRTIQAFGRGRYESDRFLQSGRAAVRRYIRLDAVSSAIHPVAELLTALLFLALLVFALYETSGLPLILTFLLLLFRLIPHVRAIDTTRIELAAASPSIERVRALTTHAATCAVSSGARPFETLHRGITFEAVSFRYADADAPALDTVSLHVPSGKTTAIVGSSGSGKTTLAYLLLRLYDPSSGTIRIDGTPLPAYDLASWRERIAIVSLDMPLLNRSIRDNITYGRPGASEADLHAAIAQAGLTDVVDALPQGLETNVGDAGMRLSAGQRQRIALARAYLRDPALLVLDEALNALDSRTEASVQNALQRLCRHRTVVVIAHEVRQVLHADQIIVLEAGHVRERGTPADLLAAGGIFASMYELQRRTWQAPVPSGEAPLPPTPSRLSW